MKQRSLGEYINIFYNNRIVQILYGINVLAFPFIVSSKSLDNIYVSLASITTIALGTFFGFKGSKTYSHIEYICKKHGFQNFMFEKKGLKSKAKLYATLNNKLDEFFQAEKAYKNHKELNFPKAANF